MNVHTVRTDADDLARALIQIGDLARKMPPAWDGAKISQPVLSPIGGNLGRILPGRGLYLADDLKNLGIKKRLPNVYERSPISFLKDACYESALKYERKAWRTRAKSGKVPVWVRDPERGAITTYDGIINARANGKSDDIAFSKLSFTTVAVSWASLFLATGLPGAGAYSALGSGVVPTRATAGALSLGLTNPTDPDKKYLLTLGYGSTQAINMIMLHDILFQCGGVSMVNTANAVNGTDITRQYGSGSLGAGALVTYEVTTVFGATSGTIQLASYEDQDGNTGIANTAQLAFNVAIVKRLVSGVGETASVIGAPFTPLATGDYGVRSVTTVTSAGNTGGGVCAVLIYKPLAFLPGLAANVFAERDSTTQIDSLTELVEVSDVIGCLNIFILPNTTTSGIFTGHIRTCAG